MSTNEAAASDVRPSLRNLSAFARRLIRISIRVISVLLMTVVWLWCVGGLYFLDRHIPLWMPIVTASVLLIGFPLWALRYRGTVFRRARLLVIGLILVGLMTFYGSLRPSHDRNWRTGVDRIPTATIEGNLIQLANIRSFRYELDADGTGRVNERYVTRTFDLDAIESVWFGVDRFSEIQPMAHTFLSFGFISGEYTEYVAFSVEARRETDENEYSPFRGIYRQYEIIYVVADEQDLLSLRSGFRQNVVQLYPIRANKEQMRALFYNMAKRTNEIAEQPEFYDTLFNNCTNNLVAHVNTLSNNPINAAQRGVMFPGYSDWLAYHYEFIDTELSLEEARQHFRIDDRVTTYDGTSDFSRHIRSK